MSGWTGRYSPYLYEVKLKQIEIILFTFFLIDPSAFLYSLLATLNDDVGRSWTGIIQPLKAESKQVLFYIIWVTARVTVPQSPG